jgi:hypothetical protein
MKPSDDTRKNPFSGRDYNAPSNMTRIGNGVECTAAMAEPRNEAEGTPVQDWTSVHVIFYAERGTDTGRLARVRPWRWYSKQIDGQSGGTQEVGRWIPDFEVLVALDPAMITGAISSHYVWDTRSAEKMIWQVLDVVDVSGNSTTWPTWVKYQPFGYNTQRDAMVVAIAAGTAGSASASASSDGDGPAALKATHWSPVDGTVAFTTGTTLTTAGFPFVVDNANCIILGIAVVNAAGVWTRYLNGIDGVSITAAAGTVTIAGAGAAPFVVTDTDYYLYVAYQDKAYTLATDSLRVEEIQPLNHEHTQPEYIINELDITTAADDYAPSADGVIMDGYKDFAIQLHLLGGVDNQVDRVVTVTIEGSNDLDAGAGREWVALAVGYDLSLDSTEASWASTGAVPLDTLVDFDNWMHKRLRVHYVWDDTPDDTPGEIVATIRRKAL